jgi:hypothetical protein
MQKGGGSILAAVPIWHNFMVEALKKYEPESFPKPDPINVDKPILKGEYIINLKIGDNIYPQIHNILFWIDKNNPLGPSPFNFDDPQAMNWEWPVSQWILNNLDNPQQYNANIPYQYASLPQETPSPNISINFLQPQNGDFINSNNINLSLEIKSNNEIKSLQIFFNDQLIREENTNIQGTYQIQISPTNLLDQNQIKVVACDVLNFCQQKDIIIFKSNN